MVEFTKINITKFEAATIQLEMAIKIFFEARDTVSPYTLACAADGILEGIYKSKRSEILSQQLSTSPNHKRLQFSWNEEIQIRIKEEHHKEAFTLLNRPQNFFKHADKDPDEKLAFGGVEETASRIFVTCLNYNLVVGRQSKAIGIYASWYLLLYPQFMSDDNPIIDVLKDSEIGNDILCEFGFAFLQEQGYRSLHANCPELVNLFES